MIHKIRANITGRSAARSPLGWLDQVFVDVSFVSTYRRNADGSLSLFDTEYVSADLQAATADSSGDIVVRVVLNFL